MPTVTEVTSYYYCLLLPGQLNLGCWEGPVADAASLNLPGEQKRRAERGIICIRTTEKVEISGTIDGKEDAGNLNVF